MPLTEEAQTNLYDRIDEARGAAEGLVYTLETEVSGVVSELDSAMRALENVEVEGEEGLHPVVVWYEENFPNGGNDLNDNELAYVMGSRLVEYYVGNN